jgi:hypothetical protein
MMTLWTVLLPLAQEGPDPADVKPGWLGFGVFLLLVAAVVLLWLSFRKQLGKVNFEEKKSQPTRKPENGNGDPSHA